MNTQGFGIPVDIDFGKSLGDFAELDRRLGITESQLKGIGRLDPFGTSLASLDAFNRKLADGTRIYQTVERSLKSYKDEVKRLTAVENELIHAALSAKNALDYDEAQRSLVVTRQRITELKDGISQLDTNIGKAGKSVGGFTGLLLKGVGLLAAYFSVDSIIDAEAKIIDITGEYEKYNAVLTNGLKSQRLAGEGLAMISKLAVDTPFQLNELTESYVKLVNQGFRPTNAELIKQGDLAAKNAKSFDQLTEAIIDGVVGEYERLKEFGIRAKTVGDSVVFSFQGIEKQVKKTDQEAIRQAILSFGELQGVAGSMSVISTTLTGKISNLSDSYDQFLKNLGEKQGGALYTVIGLMGKFVGFLRDITSVPIEEKLRREQTAFNELGNSILLTNQGSAERKLLLSELVTKYPEYLGFLVDEKITNEGLARVMATVNEQYETKIRLAALDVIAQRNSEKIADAITRQREALKGTVDAYKDYLKSLGQTDTQIATTIAGFKNLSKEQQNFIIRRLIARQQALLDRRQGQGGEASAFDQDVETAVSRENALRNLQRASDAYNQSLQDQKDNTTDIVTLQKEEQRNLDIRIDKAKQELAVLKEKKNLTDADKRTIKELEAFIRTAPNLVGTPTTNLPKPKPTVDTSAIDQLKKLLQQQIDAQEKYEAQISKIELDAKNVRLSLLDKFSSEYLTKKREYDQAVLAEERKNQVVLYAESVKTIVKFKDAAGKVQQELRSLLDTTSAKYRAQGMSAGDARNAAISEIDKNQFSSDPRTAPVRGLLDLRGQVNEKNNAEDIRVQQAALTKERIDALGQGFTKEILVLQTKYKELYNTYKGNEELIAELRKREALETQQTVLASQQSEIDKRIQNQRALIDLTTKRAGETETDFEKRKQKALLENERQYYIESLSALETYLESQIYLRSVANGNVSDEQKKANDDQLKLLRAQVTSSTKALDNFATSSKGMADKYANLWEVFQAGSTRLFGEGSDISKFFNDPKNQDAVEKFYTGIKGLATAYFDAEIQASKDRVAAFDTEVNEKEKLVDDENEKRKAGLSNSYQSLKADLDATKKAREDEKEHLKKVQKEKAAIDALEVASTTAVTAANLVSTLVSVLKGASTIPIAGVFLGLALAATLVSGFVTTKAKLAQAAKLRRGKDFSGRVLTGDSHENGGLDVIDPKTGEKLYEMEGRERLMGLQASMSHNELLEHINSDSFRKLSPSDQQRLLGPLGAKFGSLTPDVARSKSMASQQANSRSSREFDELRKSVQRIERNTGRISELTRVAMPDGRIAIYKGDTHIGYDLHADQQ